MGGERGKGVGVIREDEWMGAGREKMGRLGSV